MKNAVATANEPSNSYQNEQTASFYENREAYKEKLKVVIISIVASSGLAILKLVIGFYTNSLAILSEAMHSGLDIVAALMTFYAVNLVMRPPDLKYTYGYAKVESLASLTQIILLFAVAGWVFYEGVERIFFKIIQPEITIFSFAIIFVSIGVDFGRSRSLYRIARKYCSQALEADALHFKADILSSGIVLIGLLSVLLWSIPNADAYAALAVSAMIIYTSLGLGRRTLDILLDKAPKGAHEQILESVSGLNDINSMHNIRVRRVGTKIFVDMHIEVPRTYTHDRAHRVATAVEERVKRSLPNSDVLVHVDAVEITNEKIRDRIRLIAAETEGIRNVHSIYLSTLSSSLSDDKKSGGLDLSDKRNKLPLCLYLDVQMDDNLDLKAAHGIIDAFEKTLKNEVSDVLNITTHIETETSKDVAIGREKKTNHLYLEKIRNAALSIDRVVDCGDIRVIDISNELHVILTIKIDSASEKAPTIEDAHKVATNVQDLLTKQTGASRVVVHTEPA